MSKSKYFYVVAGTYTEYHHYVKERQSRPDFDGTQFAYVFDVSNLYGLTEIEGCFYGSYEKRKDYQQIKTQIETIKYLKELQKTQTITTISSGTNGIAAQSFGTITNSSITVTEDLYRKIAELEKRIDELTSKNTPGPAVSSTSL